MSDDKGSDLEPIEGPGGSPSEDGREPTDTIDIPAGAFISPDEPVRDAFRDALISPDDPIPRKEEQGGVVVGMDGSAEHGRDDGSGVQLDPEQIAVVLEDMAAGLREHGMPALQATPGTPRFETVLKAYLAGYLSGRY